jgi:hypothetical protein
MYEKLIKARNNFENITAIISGILAILLFLTPIFTTINWRATLPGAFIFLSYIGFVLLRKQERKVDNKTKMPF